MRMKNIRKLCSTLYEHGISEEEITFDISLKDKCSFKIGGKADIFFEPKTYKNLVYGLNFFAREDFKISSLGGGTNLLISDEGVEGVVLSLKNFNAIRKISTDELEAEAGVQNETMSSYTANSGLAGFENFAFLPGTIGGALFMNARCYSVEISSQLKSVKYLKLTCGKFLEGEYLYKREDWEYKKSPFQAFRSGIQLEENAIIILSAIFKLERGDKRLLEEIRQKRIHDRNDKGHFLKPSCGSTFKNNRNFGKSSGAIIDELGLKGLAIGKAQVAPFHGNFIINNGDAKAKDVRALIEKIQAEVKAKKGFELEAEVIFAGRW